MAIRSTRRTSDRSESDCISSNPIKLGLKSFRRRFRLQCNKLDISESLDASTQVELWIGEGASDIQSDLLDLLMTLLSLPAARALQSRNGDSTLSSDLAFFYTQISSHAVDVRSTIPLLTQIIEPAPDVAIWNEVFALVARSTTTPMNSFKLEPDTPLKSTTSSQQGSEQTHAEIDPRILQEVDLCLYENTKGFYK
ncbi:hypothetical protein MMC31_007142, partial [Peltigera leucophlebia]|nr:hypothetical protein [Peltigera leucophlebia]